MLVWALPVLIVMTLLSFLSQFLGSMNISQDGLRYIGPMAVGFIIVAAYRIGRKVVKDKITLGLLFFGAITTYFIREAWIFPLVLIIGGMVSIVTSEEKNLWSRVKLNPPWAYLIAFGIFAIGSILLTFIWDNRIFHLFESFYRYKDCQDRCLALAHMQVEWQRNKSFFERYYCCCRWVNYYSCGNFDVK